MTSVAVHSGTEQPLCRGIQVSVASPQIKYSPGALRSASLEASGICCTST